MKDSFINITRNAPAKIIRKPRSSFIPRMKNRLDLVRARNQYKSDPFFSSREWLTLRYRVLLKGDGRCSACGATGRNVCLHVDHIKPRSLFPSLALSEENLQVLCEACNLGKGAWDSTHWKKR